MNRHEKQYKEIYTPAKLIWPRPGKRAPKQRTLKGTPLLQLLCLTTNKGLGWEVLIFPACHTNVKWKHFSFFSKVEIFVILFFFELKFLGKSFIRLKIVFKLVFKWSFGRYFSFGFAIIFSNYATKFSINFLNKLWGNNSSSNSCCEGCPSYILRNFQWTGQPKR